MIADNFWKIIFILIVLTGLVFWFKNNRENRNFKANASELADLVSFEEENPVTRLMTDSRTGKLQPEILNEKALTAILEGAVPLNKLDALLDALEGVSADIDTVMCIGLSSRVREDGSLDFDELLKTRGMAVSTSGKVNIGLGRR